MSKGQKIAHSPIEFKDGACMRALEGAALGEHGCGRCGVFEVLIEHGTRLACLVSPANGRHALEKTGINETGGVHVPDET